MLGLCRRFGCLPYPGSLMDQPAGIVRMISVFDLAHPQEGEQQE